MLINTNSKAAHHYISKSSMLHQLRTFLMTGARNYTANNRAIRCKNTKKKEMQKVIFCLRYHLDRKQQQEVREFRGVRGERVRRTYSFTERQNVDISEHLRKLLIPAGIVVSIARIVRRKIVGINIADANIATVNNSVNNTKLLQKTSNSESDELDIAVKLLRTKKQVPVYHDASEISRQQNTSLKLTLFDEMSA